MGIQGLLPLLDSITETIHISSLRGKRVAVDSFVWLHKAAYSCSEELCRGQPTTKYIDYCMHRIRMLKHHNITPIMVFDGGLLPAKKKEQARRYKIRQQYKERARKLTAENNHKAAQEAYQRAVDISPLIAHNLIQKLQHEEIEFLVSPYEADAQLAYLSSKGIVDAIITEDSDLLPYGCKDIIFKLDKHGNGKQIRSERLVECLSPLSFEDFTMPMFRQMCILSGCDYLPSANGLGIRGAYNLIKIHKDYKKAISYIQETRSYVLPDGYEEKFEEAELTFLYQRVWDPLTQEVMHLHPLPPSLCSRDLSFLGDVIDADMGYKIANGIVNPQTYQPWNPQASSTAAPLPYRYNTSSLSQSNSSLPITPTKISVYHTPQSQKTTKPFIIPRKKHEKSESKQEEPMPAPNFEAIDLETRKTDVLVPASPETPSPLAKRSVLLDKETSISKVVKRSLIDDIVRSTEPKSEIGENTMSHNYTFLGEEHPIRKNQGNLQKLSFCSKPEKSYLSPALQRFKQKKKAPRRNGFV